MNEEEIKTVENNEANIAEMDAKSEQVLEELKEQAHSDLADAKVIDYAVSEEDVKVVTELLAQLKASKTQLDANKEKLADSVRDNNRNNELLRAYLDEGRAKNSVTNPEFVKILTNNIEQIDKAIKQNNDFYDNFQKKSVAIDNAIELFTWKTNDEGKAYLSDDILKLAYALLYLR